MWQSYTDSHVFGDSFSISFQNSSSHTSCPLSLAIVAHQPIVPRSYHSPFIKMANVATLLQPLCLRKTSFIALKLISFFCAMSTSNRGLLSPVPGSPRNFLISILFFAAGFSFQYPSHRPPRF